MEISQSIRAYAAQPLTHQLLSSLLKDYKQPNAKLHALLRDGILEPIKKGLYIAGQALDTQRPEPFLLANHILGPSYISSDSALSYYDMIPERVYEITSVTMKPSRMFQTPMGLFSYAHLPLPYYAFGIRQAEVSKEQSVMIASPEKALFDKMITTSGILLRSPKNARSYLLEDLRMDEAILKTLDIDTLTGWLADAPKKTSLEMVIKTIRDL